MFVHANQNGPTFEVLSYDQILILDKILNRLRPLSASEVQNSQRCSILKLNFWKNEVSRKTGLKFLSEKKTVTFNNVNPPRVLQESWIKLQFAAFVKEGFLLWETLKIAKTIFLTLLRKIAVSPKLKPQKWDFSDSGTHLSKEAQFKNFNLLINIQIDSSRKKCWYDWWPGSSLAYFKEFLWINDPI